MGPTQDSKPIGRSREKSAERAYRILRAKIVRSELRPGTQLLEREIVKLIGVSRTPVREALLRLQHEHLVKIIPRHGMRVRNISRSDMEGVFQVQTSLEGTAAELVAARRPDAREMEPLNKACAAMDLAFANYDRKAFFAARESFYVHLVELSGNPTLTRIVGGCSDQLRPARELALSLIELDDSQQLCHLRAIVDAMMRGDVTSARVLCSDDRERHCQVQISTLKRLRLLDV